MNFQLKTTSILFLLATQTASGAVTLPQLIKGDDALRHFAIAGPDRQFVWAETWIEGNKVVVRSDKVLHPVAVRYSWADNPEGVNLYNREGLPASPFRTKD